MAFQYKGLKETLERVTVTDELIDRQLENLRRQTPEVTVIDNRPTQLGDEVLLDYIGTCNGVAFEGGSGENQALTLGSGTFIPGFEEQLLDKKSGEAVTVCVTFPKEYPHSELAGKPAEFACVIRQIRTKSEYALDDRFAQDVGHCASMAEMREKMAESLRAYYDERAEEELLDKLLRQAAATLDFTPKEAQIKEAVELQLDTLKVQLAKRGLTLEQYCSFTGKTDDVLRQELRPDAEQSLRLQAAMETIAELEGIQAEESEVAEACAQLCEQNGISPEKLQELYDDAFASAICQSVVGTKVLHLLRQYAQITEVKK